MVRIGSYFNASMFWSRWSLRLFPFFRWLNKFCYSEKVGIQTDSWVTTELDAESKASSHVPTCNQTMAYRAVIMGIWLYFTTMAAIRELCVENLNRCCSYNTYIVVDYDKETRLGLDKLIYSQAIQMNDAFSRNRKCLQWNWVDNNGSRNWELHSAEECVWHNKNTLIVFSFILKPIVKCNWFV